MLAPALTLLFAPLIGFVIQYFAGRRLPRQGDWLTVATIGLSFGCAVSIALSLLGGAQPLGQTRADRDPFA